MGRSGSVVAVICVLTLVGALPGCGGGSATTSTTIQTPLTLTLSPTPDASLEVGKTVTFLAFPENNQTSPITEAVNYQSSNTAVLTIASSGNACAGSWDSLTAPTVCTPGPAGIAQVTATVGGVTSPPTTVYVHQHIDSVTISPVPTANNPVQSCLSKDKTFLYQASAFSRGVDITTSVGPFTWTALNSTVVALKATTPTVPITGLLAGQAIATAGTPGFSPIFAGVGGITSVPFSFNTCPVQSIVMGVNGLVPVAPILGAQGSSQNITATVIDTQENPITGVPLTWCSSNPGSVTVGASGTNNCSTNSTQTVAASMILEGGSTVIAACTPPTCNIGILPSLPVYPVTAVDLIVGPAASTTSTSTTGTTSTVWVTSTDCGTLPGCSTEIIPITFTSGSTTAPTLGTGSSLPSTPNSLVFDNGGTKAYLGTDEGDSGTRGLMVMDPSASPATITQFTTAVGKVLAVAPDASEVVLSDTVDTPQQVFVFNTTSNASQAFPISGATAAAFSPDGLKAYIVAGSTLYVYSTLDALQSVSLNAPATDAAFLASGAFGYLAGGDPAGVSFLPTCDGPGFPQTIGTVNVPNASMIRAMPDGQTMLVLSPPIIQTFTATITGTAAIGEDGCPAPRGFLNVTNTPLTAVNLGQGNFTPNQVIISADGTMAYVVAGNIGSILAYNVRNRTTTPLALIGNAAVVQASLSTDGTQLYVAASDGLVHVIDTDSGSDIEQISFPSNLPTGQGGLCNDVSFVCNPNLIAVKP